MILRRIGRYLIAFAAIILVLSIFSIHKHWDVLTAYFASGFYSLVSTGLYFLIFIFGFWMMIKSLFR